MLGLEERLVDYKNTKNILDMFNCDFTKANQKLIKKRAYSIEYLKNALESATKAITVQKKLPFKITDMCCGCGACATVWSQGSNFYLSQR